MQYSYNSTLAQKILRRLRKPEFTHLLIIQPQQLGELQEVKIWYSLSNLDDVLSELNHQVEFLSKAGSYIEVVTAIKFYIIGWNTLSDVLAKFINAAFNLGIDDKDLNLTMVLRNSHVKKTDLPKILSRYRSKLHHDQYSRLRNEIVHRGTLIDNDLEAIRQQISTGVREIFLLCQ